MKRPGLNVHPYGKTIASSSLKTKRAVRYFWVKPSDVAIYVERGAADIGVAGKNILLEYTPDVYELMDLGVGKCRMAVAAMRDFRDNPERTLRVATIFPALPRRTTPPVDATLISSI